MKQWPKARSENESKTKFEQSARPFFELRERKPKARRELSEKNFLGLSRSLYILLFFNTEKNS